MAEYEKLISGDCKFLDKKCDMIGESIARLPSECLEDIKSRDDAVYAKETALH